MRRRTAAPYASFARHARHARHARLAAAFAMPLAVALVGCGALRSAPDPLDELDTLFPPPPELSTAVALPTVEAPTGDVALAVLPPVVIPEEALPTVEEMESFLAELEVEPLGRGVASYYGRRFAGRRTASGERFNPERLTAAHRTLPFGSRVRVTNLRNGASVVVLVNDRGPFAHGRVIDVSRAAARVLGMIHSGTAPVKLELLPEP